MNALFFYVLTAQCNTCRVVDLQLYMMLFTLPLELFFFLETPSAGTLFAVGVQ